MTETKLVALISDNYAVELMPTSFAPGDCVMLPLHHHCLFERPASISARSGGCRARRLAARTTAAASS